MISASFDINRYHILDKVSLDYGFFIYIVQRIKIQHVVEKKTQMDLRFAHTVLYMITA